jgi:flagellar M-ring protein FliF
MDYLKQLLGQLSEIVKRMSVSQVVMLVAVVVGCIVGIIAIAGWVGKVNYQPLYTNLEPSEAAEVVRYLVDNKIQYQLTNSGTTIEVPEKNLYEARLSLASQGLPHSGTVGYSIFDQTNLGMTDFLQKLNYRRALEGELGRTISSLSEVKACRVHIVIPEERLFADQQQEATASVVLKLRRSGGLAKSQISGITHLVSSSVEGLKPGNITIVDSDGNMLSSPVANDQLAAMSASQMEMSQTVEKDLERKAQTMLDGVLGPGKSIVRVSTELNFNQYSKTSENYDPNTIAVRSEQKTENTDVAQKKSTQAAEDKQDNRSNVSITNYEVSKTVETQNNAVGTIKRVSVAVLLDGNYKTVKNANGVEEMVYEPRPQEEIDRLGAIVKNAVGFSSERSDQLEIVNIAFDKTYLKEEEQGFEQQYNRQFYYEIGKKVVVGLLVLAAAFFVYRKVKKFFAGLASVLPSGPNQYYHPGMTQAQAMAAMPQDMSPPIVPESRQPKLVDQMQKVAKEDPEEIARVIKTMMVE